jgi:hypothetical protein
MNFCRTIILSFTVLLNANAFAEAQVIPDQIGMTTAGASWTITIDGRKLDLRDVKVKADDRSAYFLMEDKTDGLNVSFYIEPVDKCKTSEECRDHVLGLGNTAWGKFQDLAKSSIGKFSYFEFFRPEVQGQPVKMQDMYAQYVADGYWVDLHISKVLYTKADKALFERLINSIKFVSKSGKPLGVSDAAQTAAERWLALWGAPKCKESYLALSPTSRSKVTEQQWSGYCEQGNAAYGRMKSRQMIAYSLLPSIHSKPELAGAILAFRSTFEKRELAVEFVNMVREKDGTWTVSNYLMQ